MRPSACTSLRPWFEAALPAGGGDPTYVTTVDLGEAMKFHPQAFWNSDGTRLYYRKPVEKQKPTGSAERWRIPASRTSRSCRSRRR